MASFGPRRLLKVRKGGLLYKFWKPAIPRGVWPLKRVQTSVRAALVPSKADQRQIGGRTWPVLVPGGCRRSGKGVYYINFGGQLYQGVSDHLKGSKPAPGQLYCLQKLIRDRLEVAHGQFWSQDAAEGQERRFMI